MRHTVEIMEPSEKFKQVQKLLEGPLKEQNVVVFSKYATTFKLLWHFVRYCWSLHLDRKLFILTGEVKAAKRRDILQNVQHLTPSTSFSLLSRSVELD